MRTRTCKARLSIKNKKKCGNKFPVTKKTRKFCCSKCAKRDSEIRLREKEKKEEKQRLIDKNKLEKSITLRGKVNKLIEDVGRHYGEVNYYQNIKKPKIKKGMNYEQKWLIEEKQREYETTKQLFKANLPAYESAINNNLQKMLRLVRKAYNEATDKKMVIKTILAIQDDLDSLFPDKKISKSFKTHTSDLIKEIEPKKVRKENVNMMDFFRR